MTRTQARGSALQRVTSVATIAAVAGLSSLAAGPVTGAYAGVSLSPGKLLVSTSVWGQNANIVAGSTQLPPGCSSAAGAADPCVTAEAGGSYPQVFNNDGVDSSFGVTQPIVLNELDPVTGNLIASQTVPNSATTTGDQLVTSFSSKSEVSLNQSTDGHYVTFSGYVSPLGAIDASNANSPGVIDPSNSAGPNTAYRAVASLDAGGNYQFTETNAYSGNNSRAAILDPALNTIYTVGNAGNGSSPEPAGVVSGSGAQIMTPSTSPESAQSPGQPTPLANFNANTQLGIAADTKPAKDNNFRGLTISGNVIYFTKGSGSNGVDTVYYLDTTGATCPQGSGLPSPGATLPSASSWLTPAFNAATDALTPTNTCVLKGFPTASAKNATDASGYPFGIWFANPTTLYVADEGAGDNAYSAATGGPNGQYTAAAASTTAGLQKWSLVNGTWTLEYVLQNGLNLGQPYSIAGSGSNSYPTGNNSYTSGTGSKATTVTGPWSPAVDGLRNINGRVNSDGTVTIWATTSTVSFSGDQGADPNALVAVTDNLAATSRPSPETFSTVVTPTYGQVVRGVSLTPTPVQATTPVSGSVAGTLSLSIASAAPNLGAFQPGVGQNYITTTGATVTTTAASSTLSAADGCTPSASCLPGHLVNTSASGGPYGLAQGLQVNATSTNPAAASGSGVYADLSTTNPATILSYSAPVSNDGVTIGFEQPIAATDPLRTGTYTKTITFTLSTTTP